MGAGGLALRVAKDGFRACITQLSTVNRLCLVTYDRVRYSVPSIFVGRQVRLEVYPERVEIYHQGGLIATHQRAYTRGDTVMDPRHYLDVLATKKRAAPRAQFVQGMPEVYTRARAELGLRPEGYREFANILLLAREFPLEQVTRALERSLTMGKPSAVVVRQLILSSQQAPSIPINVPKQLHVTLPPPDIQKYDQLSKGVGQ